MPHTSPQEYVERLKQKNLKYFKNKLPNLYEVAAKIELTKTTINFDVENGEVDLIDQGRSAYEGKGIDFARKEVEEWEKVYRDGKPIVTLRPPLPGEYDRPRHFSRYINKLVEKSPLDLEQHKYYTYENPTEMLVFMGVGLGLHIQEYLEKHEVRNVLIFEKNPEHFAASLYVVDWTEIIEPFLCVTGRTFRLAVHDYEDEGDINAIIWNDLIQYCPHFPVACLFYNHRRSSLFGNIIRKLTKDVRVFLNLWGYYDDEINQLNNGFHNFYAGIPKSPSYKAFNFKTPVVIIGSGPSLDERIDDLRKLKSSGAILISCGTALKPLASHNVMPDIHVELESHKLTYEIMDQTLPEDWKKNISFFGAAQLHPDCFKIFGKNLFFIKDSSSMASVFCKPEEIIKGTTPTCTNTGLAMALYYQAREVYLIGLDFGFKSIEKHHASSTVYFDEEADQDLKDNTTYDETGLIKEIGVEDKEILTTPSYFTAKRRVEVEIRRGLHTLGNIRVFNLSMGAKIEHTTWLSPEEFDVNIANIKVDSKQADLDSLFSLQGAEITKPMLKEAPKIYLNMYKELSIEIPQLLTSSKRGVRRASEMCTKVNYYMENKIKPKYGSLYYMARGTIWHFMFTLYTHAWALDKTENGEEFIDIWVQDFKNFVETWPDHVASVICKDFSLDDPWLKTSVTEEYEGVF